MEKRNLTCIGCPLGCQITAEGPLEALKISGYTCKRGLEYAKKELTAPERTVTSTVRVLGGSAPVTSVRTVAPVPKAEIWAVMAAINALSVPAPLEIGDVVEESIAGTGVALIVTKAVK